jgi:hypothetical protein
MNWKSVMSQNPPWARIAQEHLTPERKTPAGPVTSKVEQKSPRWGYTCNNCEYIYIKPGMLNVLPNEWHRCEELIIEDYKEYIHKRCRSCRSMKKKWRRAKETFVTLDELRINEGIEVLRFVTQTRSEWTVIIPFEQCGDLARLKDEHKSSCLRSFRNWRYQNTWWQSREALGRYWPECVETLVWDGFTPLGMKLHFHTHSILVSKYLDNKPKLNIITIDGTNVDIMEDSKFCQEWGGIVDVRAVKDYKQRYVHNGIEHLGCGRKACMRYLIKYISKAEHWKSAKIGKW